MNARVLVVDDDGEIREALGNVFSGGGQTCKTVESASAALEILGRQTFDVIICDVRMEGMSGLELLDRVKRIRPSLPFIVITALGGIHDAVDAIKRGAFQYVTKPCDADQLRTMVVAAMGDGQARGEADDGARGGSSPLSESELIGLGPTMCALNASIDLVATSSAPVLVTGETGVGKELVARAIHSRGDRRGHPFVALNTCAVQDDLVESELFGHVRGAFTGAAQPRGGLMSAAAGGTMFLDEIGDMSLGMQAKLLRVLQFGEVRPVGSDRWHRVDARIITATHRDLPGLIREGKFREDLYFRLNVLPVFVPPLRAHPEDIPALAEHFLAQARHRASGARARSFGVDALRVLTDARWPGNVRELASVIERAVVLSTDETLAPEHLSLAPTSAPPPALSWPPMDRAPWTLQRLSETYTDWVLAQTAGDKQRAAEILGIDLSTLYRWKRAQRR